MKKIFIILIFGIVVGFFLRDLLREKPVSAKLVTIRSRNLDFQVATTAKTVGEVLEEEGFVSDNALSFPLTNGMTIEVRKPLNIELMDEGKEVRKIITQAATVGDFLSEQKIGLAPTDQVRPELSSFLVEGMKIVIDRIVHVEMVERAEIPYEIKLEYDPGTLYGREEVISQGEVGTKEQFFSVTYKNGVEIKRKLLAQKVLEKPVTEIRKFGTKVEVEESLEGRASWYAHKGCMCAAHPFYDIGRYVMVTNLASGLPDGKAGKSIIVKINDRGPELEKHPDRAIDLDLIAFKQLALLGAGTISVKVELLRY